MAKLMLIDSCHSEEIRVAIIADDLLEDFDFEAKSKKNRRGNIYLAKVTRVEPSLQAAFINYGEERHGFLVFTEIHPDYYRIPVVDREILAKKILQMEDQDCNYLFKNYILYSNNCLPKYNLSCNRKLYSPYNLLLEKYLITKNYLLSEEDYLSQSFIISTNCSPNECLLYDYYLLTNSALLEEKYFLQKNHLFNDEKLMHCSYLIISHNIRCFKDLLTNNELLNKQEIVNDGAFLKGIDLVCKSTDVSNPSVSSDSNFFIRSNLSINKFSFISFTDKELFLEKKDPNSLLIRSYISLNNNIMFDDFFQKYINREKENFHLFYKKYKIQEVIQKNQILLVQVLKEERGDKGAAVTTYISIAGRYSVLMTNLPDSGGVSRKIDNIKERKKLRLILDSIEVPYGMSLIIRTAGLGHSKLEIKRDSDYLISTWHKIRDLTFNSVAPSIVYEEGNIIKRSLRDLYSKDFDEIILQGDEIFKEAKN